MSETRSIDVVTQINNAAAEVLSAADHLTNEYTRHDHGHGTGVGMHASEDRLMMAVFRWRKACGGQSPMQGMTGEGMRLLYKAIKVTP